MPDGTPLDFKAVDCSTIAFPFDIVLLHCCDQDFTVNQERTDRKVFHTITNDDLLIVVSMLITCAVRIVDFVPAPPTISQYKKIFMPEYFNMPYQDNPEKISAQQIVEKENEKDKRRFCAIGKRNHDEDDTGRKQHTYNCDPTERLGRSDNNSFFEQNGGFFSFILSHDEGHDPVDDDGNHGQPQQLNHAAVAHTVSS